MIGVEILPYLWRRSIPNAFRTTKAADALIRRFAEICTNRYNLEANGGDRITLTTFVASPAEIITQTGDLAEKQRKIELFIKEFMPPINTKDGQPISPDLLKLIIAEVVNGDPGHR